ncbi:hypothetical protein NAD41_000855 [Salmonella enterica]|nr:hypothetical protein [Salmonella enterica]EKK6596362.1 hypothetical protein [Salmonella enterica]
MFKFLSRFLKPKPAPRRPQAIRRQRINPVYFLEPEQPPLDRVNGQVRMRMTEVTRGNDVSGT